MDRRRRWLGTLGSRLLAAFLCVAVGAVALLALVAAVSVDQRTATLLEQQRTQLRQQVASALAAAYASGRGSWRPESLAGVQVLAEAHGAQIVVRDSTGRAVTTIESGHPSGDGTTHHTAGATSGPGTVPVGEPTHPGEEHGSDTSVPAPRSTRDPMSDQEIGGGSSPAPASDVPHDHDAEVGMRRTLGLAMVLAAGPEPQAATAADNESLIVPILVDGAQVGSAELTLPLAGEQSVAAAREALLRSVGVGALLAALLAAFAAAFVARRMSRPLIALTVATRSFAAGDPEPERLLRPAPGELGEVGRSFAAMAAILRQQDALRRSVVADVAHELRTPVTILRGQTEQLLDGIVDPTTARLLSLHDEVLRLQRLTDDLAALSAADASGLTMHCAPVDLGGLTAQATEAMAAGLDEADLQLNLHLGHEILVSGDAVRLTQVVTNLLTNAVKFTPPGGTVTVTVGRDGAEAVLTVADTGPGISAEDLPHVFERFWRGRTAGSRSGTGIGLAVARSLTAAHGGVITAESPSAGGTRFTVRLPHTPGSADATPPARAIGSWRPVLATAELDTQEVAPWPVCSSSTTNGRSANCCAPTSNWPVSPF